MKHNFLSLMLAGTIISAGALTANSVLAEDNLPAGAPKMEHRFNREDFHQKMSEKIAKELNLTEEQQAKTREIREEGQKEIEPLMKEMKDLREKMDTKRKANLEKFEAILTPEQKAKFEEMKKQDYFQGSKGFHGPHGAPFGGRAPEKPAEIEAK